MPAGVQTWSASGGIEMDTTSNMGRMIGTLQTGGVSGSASVPLFSQGVPWALPIIIGSDSNTLGPVITISGTTLSWTYPYGSPNAYILYGVN